MLVDLLGYYFKIYFFKDNLVMYSCFLLEVIVWREFFKLNFVKIILLNGKWIMFVDCWLCYVYCLEYISGYVEKGFDFFVWVVEDFILVLFDI